MHHTEPATAIGLPLQKTRFLLSKRNRVDGLFYNYQIKYRRTALMGYQELADRSSKLNR